METLRYDLRHAARMLMKQPALTIFALLTLALGIGANLTIFSFIDTMFLRPLPVREPDRLVLLEPFRDGRWQEGYAYPTYLQYRDHCRSLDALVAHYSTSPMSIVAEGDARVALGAVVSANYFPVFGVEPQLGRFFLPEEDEVPDRNPVVVISHRMWQSRYGADPAVLQRELILNNTAFQIIGVAPREFQGVLPGFPTEFWIPTMMLRQGYKPCDAITRADCRPLALLGRLAPGRTVAEAQAELSLLSSQVWETLPAEQGREVVLKPALGVRRNEREGFRYQMQLLMVVTGVLLLIACANIASLLLVRGAARRKEIAIRLCIGAGRRRLVRQFLTESFLLAAGGGALGLLLSVWCKDLLAGYYTTTYGSLQRYYDLSLSPRGLAYAVGLTLFTALLFGLLPAIQSTRQDLIRDLKDEGISSTPRRQRLRSALVMGQVALSVSLLIAAGLLLRSESHVRRGINFDPEHVAALRVRPALVSYKAEKAEAFTREVMRRLEAIPGVQSVSMVEGAGLAFDTGGRARIRLPEDPAGAPEDSPRVDHQIVAPRFCETMKIPLLEGREFEERDSPSASRVVIINETLARTLWPGESALERNLIVNDNPCRVIGVSKDALLLNALEGARPFLYLPYWQNTSRPHADTRLVVRVAGDPAAMLSTLRRAIVELDPKVPISEDVPMTQQVNANYMPVLLTSTVLKFAGSLALFLSMLGLYGVLAFAVNQRTREIGIRMALGAERSDVLRLIVAHGLRLSLAGVGMGLIASFATTRLVGSLLYGVTATDTLTFAAIPVLLSLVALVACWIPASRAAKVDPMVALRYQ